MEQKGIVVHGGREDALWKLSHASGEESHEEHGEHEEHHGEHEEHSGEESHDENAEEHDDHNDHNDTHAGHRHGEEDAHIWLSPDNALVMATVIMEVLVERDPAHKEIYQRNLNTLHKTIRAADSAIRQQLAPVRDTPYAVFHDGYGYFEKHFGLSPLGSVMQGAGRQAGAKHLLALRSHLKEHGAVCIFKEPQFQDRTVTALVRGTDLRVGELDPLGSGLTPGPDAYVQLLKQLGESIRSCLSGG
ncbi:MAG: zinc ABC transporter substrate-binding protein, partial [Magnetococcales bacterium]|nr:zinc ABC transporter substrate-binding protein [Magnetococcales bacterium]